MHGLKETLKKILSVSNFKCKERKKIIYTGWWWWCPAHSLRLERAWVGKNSVTHGCQSDSLCPMRSFRSLHVKKLKKNHTNLVVVSSWSVETPWFGTWVIFRLQEIDSSFENWRRRSLRKESAKIQVFNRHHYRSWYVRYVVDIIWTLCAWYDDLWNELNDILIIFSELWVRHFRSCKTKKNETLFAISCIGECSSILYVRNHYGKSRIPCVESYRQIFGW